MGLSSAPEVDPAVYSGDVNLSPKALEVVSLPAFDRLVCIEESEPVLLFRFHKRVLNTLEVLRHTASPRGSRYRLVTGFVGTGKSTLLRRFRDTHPANPYDMSTGVQHRPVLYITTPPAATGHALCAEILRGAEIWTPAVRKNENLLANTINALRAQNVRVLIIDEMQHANLARAGRKTGALLDTLKYLGEVLDISIVCSGTYSVCAMMLAEDPPMERRFGQPIEFPLLDRHKTLPGFVDGIQRAFPLQKHTSLCTDEILDMILALTNMTPDSVTKLLKLAAAEAIETGEEQITPQLLKSLGWEQSPLEDDTAWVERNSRA